MTFAVCSHPQITEVFPSKVIIDRTLINRWEDPKVVDAVKATGRKQLIIACLWTEICVAMPVFRAFDKGWGVTVITDPSGGVTIEAHLVAMQRMNDAGAIIMPWLTLVSQWQHDWARSETVVPLSFVILLHAVDSGIAHSWE